MTRSDANLLLSAFVFVSTLIGGPAPQGGVPGPAALKNMSLEDLSQIEVTSPSREPKSAFRSPVAVFVITGEDIRRSGATTIPEALRLAPGVEVARIDSSKWSIGIRGFGTRLSRDVLVLIDGRTVYTPLFAGTYWEIQDTLLEDVDRIEIIRGPGGTIWGPNAVDGVINIITKSTKDTKGTLVSAGGGTIDEGFLNFRYGGGGNNLNWRAYTKEYTRGPEDHPDKDNFDDWRGVQAGFRMDWSRSQHDAFTLQGDVYDQRAGERVGFSTYVPPVTKNIDGYANASGENILFRWKRIFSEGNDLQIQAYWDRTARHEPNLGEIRDTADIDLLARTRLPWREEFSYGLEARVSPAHFLEVASGLVFSPAHRTDYLVSGFLQDDISLIDEKLMLTAGTKILRTNYTGFLLEPSVRLMWTPNDKRALWAAFTHAVRTPSDAEEDFYISSYLNQSVNGLPFFARFIANPKFAPEQLNAYELGYRQLVTKSLYLDVALFFNHYHDLFSQNGAGSILLETGLPFPDPAPPGPHYLFPAQFRNSLYGFTTGAEIAPEWRPTEHWRLRASYSYLNMNLTEAPNSVLAQPPQIVEKSSPRHESTVQSSYDLSKRLQFDLIYRYVSAISGQKAPGYSTGDARLGWRLTSHLELAFTGRNLFQRSHVEYAGDPGPPVGILRSGYASLAWR